MAKQIARLLKTDVMADIDLPAIAQFLQSQGRRGDSILAHINPKEAALLKKMGGAETVNPATGLPEYFKISDYGFEFGADYAGADQRAQQVADAGFEPDMNYGSQSFPVGQNTGFQESIDNYLADLPAQEPMSFGMPQAAAPAPAFELPQMPSYSMGGMRAEPMPALAPDMIRPDLTVPTREVAPPPVTDQRGTISGGIDQLSKSTGLSREALARLGLAGLGTIQGVVAAREAAAQGQQARRETEAIGRPYQERGQELIAQAQRGELTPQGQQSLQALRARLAQGAEARGGVGAAQAAAQIEAFRQNLLQNQFDYGQKISNIGDQIMMGAIRTGLEADRYAANLSNTYFTNMARIAAGIPSGVERAGGQ
jgi:hypothetical protein